MSIIVLTPKSLLTKFMRSIDDCRVVKVLITNRLGFLDPVREKGIAAKIELLKKKIRLIGFIKFN